MQDEHRSGQIASSDPGHPPLSGDRDALERVRPSMSPGEHPVRDRFVRLLVAYPIVWSILSIVTVAAPQRGGPLALSQIFAPHLLIPVLLLVPIAVSSKSRELQVGLLIALAIGAARFGPGLVSTTASPPSSDESVVQILSWNLEGDTSTTADLLAQLRASDADIVALQELTHEHAAAIRADPELTARFSQPALVPRGDAGGLGLLSRFAIADAFDDRDPPFQNVELQLPDGRLTVINAHLFAPRFPIGQATPFSWAFDPAQRDADILSVRATIERALAAGRPLIVLGDFNVTDREPGFDDLSRGLWDAHDEVGQGTGSTWRPQELEFVPFGVLRIDYFLGGPATRPLSVFEDCSPSSDHCILTGTAAVE
jgi:endonuclease/exonuclease/phosphatase (EEP) superfamily protein YafD